MLSKFSVKKPYTVFVAVILIIILGVISFMNLQTDLLPSLDLPYMVVMTSYPGASPEEVEMTVTRPVEQMIASTSNIKNISSISSQNSSMVILEFEDGANMDSAMIEVDGSLDMLKSNWNDSIGTPTLMKLNPDMLPIMITALDVEGMDAFEVSDYVKSSVIPELESVGGVASISSTGLLKEELQVELDSEKIDDLNQKLLSAIDGDLSKAENQLIHARDEMNAGLTQLEAEEKERKSKLEEGKQAIQSGKSEIQSAKVQLNTTESVLQLFDIAEEELKKLKTNSEELEDKSPEEEQRKQRIDQEISSLYQGLGEDIPKEQQQAIQRIKQIFTSIYQEPNKNIKESVEEGLATLQREKVKAISEINVQKTTLASAQEELEKQEKQITQGETALETEMGKAKEQLKEGQANIEEQLEQLEASKDQAFQQADLEGKITEEMISGLLAAQNFSMPAGYISEEGTDYVVKVGEKIDSVEEVEELLLFDTKVEGVGKVRLKDVANIQKTDNSEKIYSKVNGNDAVALSIQKQGNYSTAEVSQNLKDKFEELSSEMEGLTTTYLMDQGIYIDVVIDSVLDNLIYGAILAILILLVFLRDYKPTIIVALSIPISLVFAIAMMYFTGVSMNIISLGGLALGVGMLVDNSIVVIENVYRLKKNGLSSKEASMEGAKQVSGALVTSTLTTIAVFLPVIFVQGLTRELLSDMGLTIAYSLIASLIIALTLVPVLTSSIFKNVKEKKGGFFDRIIDTYQVVLEKVLSHKIITTSIVIGLLIVSVISAFSMGTSFIPEMEGNEMSVTIEVEEGSTLQEKTAMADQVTEKIMDMDAIESIGALQGATSGISIGGSDSNGNIGLYLLLNEERTSSNEQIAREIQDLTEDLEAEVRINTSNMDLGAVAGSGVEAVIKGDDIERLGRISSDVVNLLRDTKGTKEVTTNFEDDSTELKIIVDKEKAMEEGLTVAQVYSDLNKVLSEGETATTINVENKDYPIILVNDKKESIEKDDLEDLEIKVQQEGEEKSIKVGDIAEISQVQTLSSINREAQQRYVSVSASVDADHNIGLVSRDFEEKLEKYDIPEGYTIEIAGEIETINTTIQDLLKMIVLAIIFVYLIMVAQFQSLLSPFIVMFTIPLAVTGGLLALFITGQDISMISLLGFLVLSGVVVNNGIVFVDYTNQLRKSGLSKKEALVEAGKVRIRPILMTALTTILGLSTLALGLGTGSEMLQPLAIVAVGGLIYATILTLFVVPIMYDILVRDKNSQRDQIDKD